MSSFIAWLALAAAFGSVARARSVRVAVASGPSLTIRGAHLVARTTPGGPPVAVGRQVRLRSVGPLVSDGRQLAPVLLISDAAGARIDVNGVGLLGEVEVAATDRTLYAVDRVDLETYVASVVGSEMPPSWPMQALEAQAIAARTYALVRARTTRNQPFDVGAGVLSQVYRGAASLDRRSIAAARATRGEVLTFRGSLAQTYYFSSCTGRTESARAAFGVSIPYLVPTSCRGGGRAPTAHWTKRIALAELSRQLRSAQVIGDRLREISVVARTRTGRIARVKLVTRDGARNVSGAELRRLIGYQALPSLDARIVRRGRDLVFEGSGSGHAVGLCQWCARGRALAGESAAQILAQAYPGTRLTELR